MQKQVIKFTNRSPYPNSIFIGNEDDNLARRVQFVLPSEIDGAKIYLHLSIGEYSDVIELDDSLVYVPTRTHTQYPRNWTGYLEAHVGNDTVWHSNAFTLKVGDLPDIGEQIEQTYPSAIEEALRAVDTLTGVGARAVTLEPGSDATVSFEEDAEGKRTIIYGIPRGADGSGGGGGSGGDGATFMPSVSDEGVISWTNDKDLPNPDPVNIKGKTGPAGADGKSAYQYAQDGGYTGTEAEFAAKLAKEKFANPNALTFTGAVSGSYDGSEPLTVNIPSSGGGSGGGGGLPNWRLIKTISFSADISYVEFDADDGNTFSLKEIMLAGSVPAYSGYIYMKPNSTGVQNSIWPTASKDVKWWAASVNGKLKTMLAVSNASVIWPIDKDPVCENDAISRLGIGASGGFTADGTMYVYGR